jgi:hypothetical protein
MFLRPHQRSKDGKGHTYWSLVETVRTTDGPRQRTLCYLGELNGSAQARWLKSIEVLNDGRHSPYGLGWSTQVIGGQSVHWHYGYGDSFSALLIRIPTKKVPFILLSNTGASSAPFYLGYGNLLTSPFALAFLRDAIPGAIRSTDEVYAQAFLQHYTAALAGRNADAPVRLLAQLKSEEPERFRKSDRSMIYLLSELADPSLDKGMEQLVKAFDESGDFHHDIDLAIAIFYKRAGAQDAYLARLHRIADRPGYGEEGPTRVACVELGTSLLEKGHMEGRKYLWMAAQYGQVSGSNTSSLEDLVCKNAPLMDLVLLFSNTFGLHSLRPGLSANRKWSR